MTRRSVDHAPGPRGPVSHLDVGLRQLLVLPPPGRGNPVPLTRRPWDARAMGEAGLDLLRNSGEPRPRASRRTDVVTTVLSVWFVLGLFLDAYAHADAPELETFFTPWHAVFYSGFAVTGA